MSKFICSIVLIFACYFPFVGAAYAQLVTCTLDGASVTSYRFILDTTPGDMALKNAAANLICNNVPQLLAQHESDIASQQSSANRNAGAVAATGASAAAGAVGAVMGGVVGAAGGSGGKGKSATPSAYASGKDQTIANQSGVSAIASTHGGSAVDNAFAPPTLERSIWLRGLGGWAHNKKTYKDPSSNIEFHGAMLGMDLFSNEYFRFGVVGVLADVDVDVDADQTSVGVSLAKGGLTSSLEISVWYIDGAVIAGPEMMETRRFAQNIKTSENFDPGVNAWLRSNYSNRRVTAAFETGLRTVMGPIVVQPLAGVQMNWVNQAQVCETGHAAAAICTSASQYFVGQTKLGVNLSTAFFVGDISINPSIGAHWSHRFGELSNTLNMSFDGGSTYQKMGNSPHLNVLNISGGLNINVSEQLALAASYSGAFTRVEEAHSATLGVKLRF